MNWPLDIIFGQPVSYNVFLRNKDLATASWHIVLSPKIKTFYMGSAKKNCTRKLAVINFVGWLFFIFTENKLKLLIYKCISSQDNTRRKTGSMPGQYWVHKGTFVLSLR